MRFRLFINRVRGLHGKVFAAPSSLGLCKTPEDKYFPSDRANEVNKLFIIWLLVHFFVYFYAVFKFSFFGVCYLRYLSS